MADLIDSNIEASARLLVDVEEPFTSRYDKGMSVSTTPDSGRVRRERFYNLINLLKQTHQISGAVAECGCWKGLSAYLISHALRDADPKFNGRDFHVFDSFEGLSEPVPADTIPYRLIFNEVERGGKPFKQAGAYAARLDSVRSVLGDFPEVNLIKGWLPQQLHGQPERTYRFVHLDLDLYEPTRGAAEYFLPRLARGGILVCDDYGSLFWPGAKMAIDEACAKFGYAVLSLSAGQGVVFKRSSSWLWPRSLWARCHWKSR